MSVALVFPGQGSQRPGMGAPWTSTPAGTGHSLGDFSALVAAGAALRSAGARRVLPLPVGGAFHTPLMEPARAGLQRALEVVEPRAPQVPVVSGITAREYDGDVRRALSAQLTAPVRWRATCEALAAYGVGTVVEVGPGGVLTGLVKRCLPGVRAVSVSTPDELAALAH